MKIPKFSSLSLNTNEIDYNVIKVEESSLTPFHYSFNDFEDAKKLDKYIKRVERMVRGSIEYRNYISYLKNEIELTSCKFFSKIDIREMNRVGIEFHHYPFNLYQIVEAVLLKKSENFEKVVNIFEVADEVMELHYKNQVGLIPLSKTVHQLAHSGNVFIPLDRVFGNVNQFILKYQDYINEDTKDKLDLLQELTIQYQGQDNNYVLHKTFQQVIMENQHIENINFLEKNLA